MVWPLNMEILQITELCTLSWRDNLATPLRNHVLSTCVHDHPFSVITQELMPIDEDRDEDQFQDCQLGFNTMLGFPELLVPSSKSCLSSLIQDVLWLWLLQHRFPVSGRLRVWTVWLTPNPGVKWDASSVIMKNVLGNGYRCIRVLGEWDQVEVG